MSKYVKVEDVIELINGLDSLPWEEETEEMVNRLPAYDLDKVVERLEEELNLADEVKEKCARENQLMFDNAKGYATGIYNAIYIVRGGGVNE